MGFCGQCGAQAADGDKFCRSCGHKLPAALEGEVFCFACPAWCSSLVQWSQWNNICATGARASIRSTATASCGGGANRGEPTVAATNSAATRTRCKEAEDPHCFWGDPNLRSSERWCSIRSERAAGSEESGPLGMSVRRMHRDLQPRACLSCAQGQAHRTRYSVVHEETRSFVALVS